jgi:hypothetical protein
MVKTRVKKEKQLIKVVGTVISGVSGSQIETVVGRGIVQLTRGKVLIDYICEFLNERNVIHFTLNQRSENTCATSPIMFLATEPKMVITYVFTQFPLSEIGYYGKDLTKEELGRDFEFLKKILNV